MRGQHVVVATPTASGKSLCFHLPVLADRSADEPDARAIYLYPTKALARDQEAGLRELMRGAGRSRPRPWSSTATRRPTRGARRASGAASSSRTRTCSTPASCRTTRAGRARSRTCATSSSTSCTPTGASSARTWPTCSGACCGSRRFHGSRPVLIGATATIGNPRAHAARLFGVRPRATSRSVDESGAPQGRAPLLPLQPARRERRAGHPRELREAGRHARGRPRPRARADDRLRPVAKHRRGHAALPARPVRRGQDRRRAQHHGATAAATCPSSGATSSGACARERCWRSWRRTRSSWASTSASSTRSSAPGIRARSPRCGSASDAPGGAAG